MNKYFWIVPFASFLSGYLIMGMLFKSKTTQTPALVGKTIHEALRITANKGLSIRLVHEQEDLELPSGTVISQNPLPNTHIKTHQAIHCIVSKKTDHRAPELIGKNVEDMRAELESQGINLNIHQVASSHPQGLCIAQDPAPGIPMTNRLMTIYVSQGNTQQFIFPDLRQTSVDEIQSFLASVPVVVQISHACEQPEGHSCDQCIVSEQRPRPGIIVYLDKQKPIHVQLIATPVIDTSSTHEQNTDI